MRKFKLGHSIPFIICFPTKLFREPCLGPEKSCTLDSSCRLWATNSSDQKRSTKSNSTNRGMTNPIPAISHHFHHRFVLYYVVFFLFYFCNLVVVGVVGVVVALWPFSLFYASSRRDHKLPPSHERRDSYTLLYS